MEMSKKIKKKSKKKPEDEKPTSKSPTTTTKRRTMNLMAKIDEKSSKLLDAMVALDLAPSRSAAAALLINKAFADDKENYDKILESYDTIVEAKMKAKNNYYKTIKKDMLIA